MEKVEQFIAAIEREQAKRAITYPKILSKFTASKDMSSKENKEKYLGMVDIQKKQCYDLNRVLLLLKGEVQLYSIIELEELVREMDMRLRYYPMMVMRHMISKEDAEKEKAIWRELIEYFNEYYTPTLEVKFLKTRCRIIYNSKFLSQ